MRLSLNLVLAALAVVVAAGAAGCAKKSTVKAAEPVATAPTTPPRDRQQVVIAATSFAPVQMQVGVDTEIVWVNRDANMHGVVSPGLFDSGNIPPDGQFRFRFMKPGRYAYQCTTHPDIKGEIVVQ